MGMRNRLIEVAITGALTPFEGGLGGIQKPRRGIGLGLGAGSFTPRPFVPGDPNVRMY